MDFSFLTFSPPKRNSRIPQFGCKRRKSKSPTTSPRNFQAVQKAYVAQKMSNRRTSKGKENREKATDRHFSNGLTSKSFTPIKNIGKKVLFKPCRKTSCGTPKNDLSQDSSVVINNQCNADISAGSSSNQSNVDTYCQQGSLITSSVEVVEDSVVVISDSSCAVGNLQDALKSISFSEKHQVMRDSSVCILSESGNTSFCVRKEVQSEGEIVATGDDAVTDGSNIVANTSSSGMSDLMTPLRFPAKSKDNIGVCTEPRTKHVNVVHMGNKLNGRTSDYVNSILLVNKINVFNASNSHNGEAMEGDYVVEKHHSETVKTKDKSCPVKLYKSSLQNTIDQCLVREECDSGGKLIFDCKKMDSSSRNKFLVERNSQSDMTEKFSRGKIFSSPEHNGGNVQLQMCNAIVDDQSSLECDVPLAVSTPVLSSAKYREIENWLNDNDFNSAKESTPNRRSVSCMKTDSVNVTPNRTDDFLSVSAVEVLNNLYGNNWRSDDIHKKCNTEPVQKHRRGKELESPQIKSVKHNGQTKRSTSPSSEEDNWSEFLKNIYSNRKPNKPVHQLVHTPEFIDDNSVENSPTQYLKSQSKAVKTDVKKIYRVFQESSECASPSSNADLENCVARQLKFSSTDSDTSEKSVPGTSEKSVPDTSEKSVPTNTKQTPKKDNKTKKLQVVKDNESKKLAEGTTCVKTVQNVCTGRAFVQVQPSLSFLASLSVPTPDGKCDSEARYFKKNFAKTKESLGKKLFEIFNEKVFENKLPHDMLLQWSARMTHTAGYCRSRRSLSSTGEKIRTSRIVLSTKVNVTPERLRDTLIHEMCHAATWILDMSKGNHGPLWRAWAKKAMLVFPELPPIRRCHDYKIQTKFTYRCVGCGYSFGRHSKSVNLRVKRCGYCFGELELLVNVKNKAGLVVQTPKIYRSPRGFARFVKDNYNTVKQSQPGLKHADVMKLLSKQFKAKCQKPIS